MSSGAVTTSVIDVVRGFNYCIIETLKYFLGIKGFMRDLMLEEFEGNLRRRFSGVKDDMTELNSSIKQQLRQVELLVKDLELLKVSTVTKKEFSKEIKEAKKELRAVDYADDISELRGEVAEMDEVASKEEVKLLAKEHGMLVKDLNKRIKSINKQFEGIDSLKKSLVAKEKEFDKGLKVVKSIDLRMDKIERILKSFVTAKDFKELSKKVATEDQLKAVVEEVNSNFKVMAKEF